LEESVEMNMCEFEYMNLCVSLVDLEGKLSEFGNKFYESL